MEYYFVYLTTNKINGKQYVGSHTTRNLNDGYLGSGRPYLQNAFKKYGIENFERKILKECKTIKEARLLEEQYINEYNTLVPNGYNISPTGGTNEYGGKHSLESRRKISESLKGKFKGRKFTDEWRKKLSEAKKDFKPWNVGKAPYEWTDEMKETKRKNSIGEKNNMYGKQIYNVWVEKYGKDKADKRFEEYKEKMSKSLKGKKHNLKLMKCPYCNIEGRGPNMTRYHFNNCKNKNI
jgi:group I intron endonuclease